MKPDFHLNFRPLFALAWILALVMLLLGGVSFAAMPKDDEEEKP